MSKRAKLLSSLLFTCWVSASLLSVESVPEQQLQSLLSTPASISREELEQQPRTMFGSWISPGRVSTFYCADNRAYLRIEYWGNFPEELRAFTDAFHNEDRQTIDQESFLAYIFHYGDEDLYESIHPSGLNFPVTFDGTNYTWSPVGEFAYRKPRFFAPESQTPTQLSSEECFHLIQQNRIVFFTGTGFGKIAGVPSRGDFENVLGLNSLLPVDDMVRHTVIDPEAVIAVVRDVCQAMYDSEPTDVHYSLAAFARSKPCQVLCDNDDYVLEKTGLKPIKLYERGTPLEERTSLESLKEVEVLICLGLDQDNKGILSLFKELNPDGKILAIDLKQPNYLGSEDLFLQGDLNKVFPKPKN